MEKLDTRYEEKVKKDGVLVARKTGSPAKSGPPPNAPSWTIDPKWNGMNACTMLYDTKNLILS